LLTIHEVHVPAVARDIVLGAPVAHTDRLDSAGRLIGVNTAIFSPSGASAGVGFAMPVDTVNRVVPQLIARGKYSRSALGIEVDEDANRVLMESLGKDGVAVLRVTPGAAAAAAGLEGIRTLSDGSIRAGDVIVAVDGRSLDSVARLLSRLDDYAVGDTIRLKVVRGNQEREVTVRLQAGTQSRVLSAALDVGSATSSGSDCQRSLARTARKPKA
jgi:S1-C subfamily serine protease